METLLSPPPATPQLLQLHSEASGQVALELLLFDGDSPFQQVQRLNRYSMLWLQSGPAECRVETRRQAVDEHSLLFFTPYQPFQLLATGPVRGVALRFAPEFFCIELHKREVGCNGVLFNNVFEFPVLALPTEARPEFAELLDKLARELRHASLAQEELLFSYLKILLIAATRLKVAQLEALPPSAAEPHLLTRLKALLEAHFREHHQVQYYAERLHLTPKALGKVVARTYGKSVSQLIQERLIIEAKRELYLTPKCVKEIGYSLGFEDSAYFSRFFKKAAGITAEEYRQRVGNVSNLRLPLSILPD